MFFLSTSLNPETPKCVKKQHSLLP